MTDGRLRIEFTYQVEFPCIAAIAVEGPAGSRKINCGGDAYQDYAADWPASDEGGRQRFLPMDDFYADWADAQFGSEVAGRAAAIFSKIDCHMPRPIDWTSGPGGHQARSPAMGYRRQGLRFHRRPGRAAIRSAGAGNLERFDYWLNSFQYMKAAALASYRWHQFKLKVNDSFDIMGRGSILLAPHCRHLLLNNLVLSK